MMHGDGPIETTMDCATFDVRLSDVTLHMEMDWITSETECLSCVADLDVIELCHGKPFSCMLNNQDSKRCKQILYYKNLN